MTWISVAKELPEPTRPVLALWRAEKDLYYCTEAFYTSLGVWRYTTPDKGLAMLPDVTHWMPLPELPPL